MAYSDFETDKLTVLLTGNFYTAGLGFQQRLPDLKGSRGW
jgi:hypothetical protein